ncbi:hypothetical protein Ciccas_013883 [Cichlidogyrus casuarinus]|uniref:Uncharacterized protein n=1 Tax=Cichlidogyrus casuarinus TaxID=1844966 RepID=A0ABD2PK57_9PLAT
MLIKEAHSDILLAETLRKNPKDKVPLLTRILRKLFSIAPLKKWNGNATNEVVKSTEKQKPGIIILDSNSKNMKKRKLLENKGTKQAKRNKLELTHSSDEEMVPLAHIINQNILLLYFQACKGEQCSLEPCFDTWSDTLQSTLVENTIRPRLLQSWMQIFDSILLDPIRNRSLNLFSKSPRLYELVINLLTLMAKRYMDQSDKSLGSIIAIFKCLSEYVELLPDNASLLK